MSDSIEIIGADALAADLLTAAAGMLPAVRAVTVASGEHLRDRWKSNAAASSGSHGRRYPSSITSETITTFGDAVVEVGPDASKAQGRMGLGFELGSVNQPPHLDGKRAADVVGPQYVAALEAFVAGIL